MATNADKARILLVDDAPDTLEVLERNLSAGGYRVATARSVSEATRSLDLMPFDLVITDFKMPQVDGFDLVRYVHENYRDLEVIMITGYPSIGGAVKAVQLGACDYLQKPFTDDELFGAVTRALERLSERRSATRVSAKLQHEPYALMGESSAMQKVFRAIEKASATLANVVITGESGTGKELVARAIHYSSSRASFPFVPVNCGGIPEGLLESELFGHVKGSFTGAVKSRPGFFQAADGGTLFLDEISETSPAMQVKLLRALQDKEITMVGDSRPHTVDVRILAATNKNLEGLVQKAKFREDLYFRLSVITINVPPLRERENDVVLLATAFARQYAHEMERPPVRFSDNAVRMLKSYPWPGNVRELENVVQRLLFMSDSDEVEAPDLPPFMRTSLPRQNNLHRTLAEVECEHIRNVLASVDGNKTRAAEILGIDRKTLREKLKGSEPEE
ncbi:MAG: sigma-54 dependent transcriptional regulator [Candidatus Zixiibacteriota bacterium]